MSVAAPAGEQGDDAGDKGAKSHARARVFR